GVEEVHIQDGPWGYSTEGDGARGVSMIVPVWMMSSLESLTSTEKRSRLRGAGPSKYSPIPLYFEPWHGHSNPCEVVHHGTRQPRCTQRWYSAIIPPAATLRPSYCSERVAGAGTT